MESGNRIEVTDKDGWCKAFPLQKRLVYIGSDGRNDIVLSPVRGGGVDPRHIQLISDINGMGPQVRVVNLSAASIPIGDSPTRTIAPSAAMMISDGGVLHLGDYVLAFRLEAAERVGNFQGRGFQGVSDLSGLSEGCIGLRLSLPQSALGPEAPLDGMIHVVNQGSAPGVQFSLSLEGLPPDCYQIGPAPILFPGAEKAVPLRLYHPRRPEVPAGPLKIIVRASAEDAYPQGSVSVTRSIHVLPFYAHIVRIVLND